MENKILPLNHTVGYKQDKTAIDFTEYIAFIFPSPIIQSSTHTHDTHPQMSAFIVPGFSALQIYALTTAAIVLKKSTEAPDS